MRIDFGLSPQSGIRNPQSGIRNPQSEIRNEILDPLESIAQIVCFVAESDAQVAVHPEMVARHDQHAFLPAQPVHELGRIHVVVISDVYDCAGIGRHVAEQTAMRVEPLLDGWEVLVQNATGPRENPRTASRLQGAAGERIAERARRDRRVIVIRPQ